MQLLCWGHTGEGFEIHIEKKTEEIVLKSKKVVQEGFLSGFLLLLLFVLFSWAGSVRSIKLGGTLIQGKRKCNNDWSN